MGQLALWAPTVVSCATALILLGKFSERIADHGRRMDKAEKTIDGHTEDLIRLKAWHDGFTAGNTRG